MKNRCAIVVPVYTTQLSFLEIISLRRTIQVWGEKYPIVLVGPTDLDYNVFISSFSYNKFKVAKFDPSFFKSTKTYSDLLRNVGFYNTFKDYEYIQIAQLDTWVFEDRLEYFMSLDYDYIGGMHLHYADDMTTLVWAPGNGGFSLRKPEVCAYVLANYQEQLKKYKCYEDRLFAEVCINIMKVAPEEVAKIYSYHDIPEKFYKESGNKLPMGAHAINKHMDFYYDKMEGYPLISIIVPVYNMEKYVVDTLNSINKQTYLNWECIIVNDGSTDNSESIILDYIKDNSHFKYLKQANAGVAAARNNAIKLAKGKYILPVDPDDMINCQYAEKGIVFLETHTNYALYYSGAITFGDNGVNFFYPKYSGYKELLKLNHIHNSAIYRKKDYDKIGGYDETLPGYEDWEFYIRLLHRNDKVYFEEASLCMFRASNKSRNAEAMKRDGDLRLGVYDKNKDIYNAYGFGKTDEMELVKRKTGLSIIISAYKAQSYILETLESIYNQHWINAGNFYEVIIGIDGCNETLAALEQIKTVYPNLRVLVMDSNMGTFPTSNTLVANARYDKILRFDADDLMNEGMLDKVMEASITSDIVRYGYYEYYPETEKKVNIGVCAYGSVLYDRKVFNAAGGYRNWKCSGDYEFFWRVCDRFSVTEIKEPLYCHRNVSTSLMHNAETSMDSDYRKKVNAQVRKYAKDENIHIDPVINSFQEFDWTSFLKLKREALNLC